MTIVIGKRQALAGLATFMLGALIAVAAMMPATSTAGSSYTRSASCAGLDFYPTDSHTEYDNVGTMRVRRDATTPTGTGVFRCDPGLPNGAVVTKVQFTAALNAGLGVTDCALVRSGLNTATATTYQDIGRVSFAGTGPNGAVRLTDTSITNATIDNANWGYWFECTLSGAWAWTAPNPVSGLYGADVIYTITAAKG